ncbi:VWA domain-containing protein [Candidatus Woesearchaeota archaeon]|nr:VWA domain-containing protein [Candidatus Woesearchaeota archaeon]
MAIDLLAYYIAPNSFLLHPWAPLLVIPGAILLWLLLRSDWVAFAGEDAEPAARRRRKHLRRFVFLSRTLIILLLLIAIASPFIERETLIEGDPYLRILIDNSTSFGLFDQAIGGKLANEISKQIRVETKYVGAKDQSAIGDAVLQSLQGDGNILLVSDGQNNFGADLGDVALYAAKLNASISMIRTTPVHSDARIYVRGPTKTLEDVDNKFTIHVDRVGNLPNTRVTVAIDNAVVLDKTTAEESFVITQKLGPGYHTLIAKVEASGDHFIENNIFYKTIKVVKKPNVFFWTKAESPTYILLSQTYEMSKGSALPSDLMQYHAIVINNLNVKDITDTDVDNIIDFTSEGNGLIVIGGDNAFEKGGYKDSRFEELLPVYVAEPGKKEGDINIVVLIDISGSQAARTGGGAAASGADIGKAQAVSIITDMKPENKLGIVAFNTQGYEIEPLSYISEKAGHLEKIRRLQPGGGTMVNAGLFKALEILKPADGSKNIVLISDGVTQLPQATFDTANLASKLGVKIYGVGVGATTNEFVMKKVTELANGIYFKAEQLDRVRILFGKTEEGEAKRFTVSILDGNHFITEDITPPNAIITGYNIVVPKSTGSSLFTTQVGDPIVTAWRYGLGRIVAYTTDDGTNLAGEMLSGENSHAITRMMNWAIGDPDRTSEVFVDVEDTRIGSPTKVVVKSPEPPKAEGVAFFKTPDGLYRATIYPSALGFNKLVDATFAVNYAEEFADLGISPTLEKTVIGSGGSIYEADQVEKIVAQVKSRSKRSVIKKVYLRYPFVIAALIILLAEIAIRRLTGKRGQAPF